MKRKLNHDQQTFIVQCLARYMAPLEIAELVKEEFGIEVGRELIRGYNPEQRDVAAKWKTIFDETRAVFLKSVSHIGIAHQAYRLAELQRLYHRAGKNLMLKKELLEQAAKEVGGAFTNRREIAGPGGAPIQVETQRVNRQEWAEGRLKELMEQFHLSREEAIAALKRDAPTVLEYLGKVG